MGLMNSESTEEDKHTLQQWLEELYFNDGKTVDFTRKDIAELGALLQRLLRLDPSTRSTASAIVEDSWFQRTSRDELSDNEIPVRRLLTLQRKCVVLFHSYLLTQYSRALLYRL